MAIKEFHLFAGIGGGIYGGELLGHKCVGGVEIMDYAQKVLKQRQADGWMPKFDLYGDIKSLNGADFEGQFDVLCGGFPCQAFSPAARGRNRPEKNLWPDMFRFVKESKAPVVFGENVVLRAIEMAKHDLESAGYVVQRIRLGNHHIGADHRRNRYWLLAVRKRSYETFERVAEHVRKLQRLTGGCWGANPQQATEHIEDFTDERMDRLLGLGNAQSPLVAATAFRILVNRHMDTEEDLGPEVSKKEIEAVFEKSETWLQKTYGKKFGTVHTPTTVANYCCESMQKHQGCRNYVKAFCDSRNMPEDKRTPLPVDAEYLMGFPIGASSTLPLKKSNIEAWKEAKSC